eukprot:6177934-Pleurochrysis_carterae.AAC.1
MPAVEGGACRRSRRRGGVGRVGGARCAARHGWGRRMVRRVCAVAQAHPDWQVELLLLVEAVEDRQERPPARRRVAALLNRRVGG